MSLQTFSETLVSITAPATAVNTTASEALLVPSYSLPANYLYQGRTLRATLMGQISNVVTAQPTITFRVRIGTTTLTGTVMAASGALQANTTANTNLTWRMEWTLVCNSSGTSGTVMVNGQVTLPNLVSGTTVGLVGYPNMLPVSAPAAATVDTTATKLLETTVQWSASNAANSIQATQYILESLT